ncbi:hypothetical protein RT723_08085 [Psychrosphaera aquimarina]|uniref:P pilus assembly protein, chaperone PapD n=1 Tax=Psychrosphaera aquimarina TaxID=2044854 RepID=A0ABU3QZW2_9GAMM|nr:hypothetical protein [Psychrosphaera aquimarina]MDU0112954.1 hypothetical protein [Psychrosphaera aquimarina]
MKLILFLLLFVWVSNAGAASLGAFRIYLDEDNRNKKFPIRNKSVVPEICEIKFNNRLYDGIGGVKKLTVEEQAELSKAALARVKYSPKSFVIEPNSTRYISFSYRRIPNDSSNEVRTYAVFSCRKQTSVEDGQGRFATLLDLAVPLVMRTGDTKKYTVDLDLEIVKRDQDEFSINLLHSGNRSVYGDVYLVDNNGKRLEKLKKNTVLYSDMKKLAISIQTKYISEQGIGIEFVETGSYKYKKTFKLSI